jgi:hypothetical protein
LLAKTATALSEKLKTGMYSAVISHPLSKCRERHSQPSQCEREAFWKKDQARTASREIIGELSLLREERRDVSMQTRKGTTSRRWDFVCLGKTSPRNCNTEPNRSILVEPKDSSQRDGQQERGDHPQNHSWQNTAELLSQEISAARA